MNEEDNYDIDDAYDKIRDEDGIFLVESVQEVIAKLKRRMYYKSNMQRIAKDMISYILFQTNLKIKNIDNITEKMQIIDFEEVKK
jgi:hypothetical protein